MNPIKLAFLTFALCAGLTSAANALPVVVNLTAPPVGDIAKNGTGIGGGNANNSANNFFRLETFLAAHPGNGTAIDDMAVHLDGDGMNVDVTGYSYAVVHYGVGRGGIQASGGGVEIFSITGDGFFSFPSNGTGPNGFGGFSSVDLFKGAPNQVPDGGTTVMLFGSALSVLGVARRYLKR
jgi:hypothetical protein